MVSELSLLSGSWYEQLRFHLHRPTSVHLVQCPHLQLYLQSVSREGVALKKMPSHRALQLPGLKEASLLDVSIQNFGVYVADAARGTVDVLRVVGSRSRQDLVLDGQVLKLTVGLRVEVEMYSVIQAE